MRISRFDAGARQRSGQVLAGVLILLAILLIIVPAAVKWVQMDTKFSVKDSQSTDAFNLAEAAIDRGMWKLKSSTETWSFAAAARPVVGYQFDVTYTDVPGGSYRINFSSGMYNGAAVVTVWGEGRDSLKKETRSIQAIYQNLSVPGGVISGGTLNDKGAATVNWGPMVAQNTITIYNNSVSYTGHFPRKLSKQAVVGASGGAANYYDTNGLTPPNTDNIEWWSDYDVPELPQFDFTTSSMSMRNQAILSNTLNCYGNWNATNKMVPCGGAGQTGASAVANMGVNGAPDDCIDYDSTNHVFKYDNRWNSNYIWYWDNDVNIISTGLKGTIIVRGNAWISGGDFYGKGQNGSHGFNGAGTGANCRPWGEGNMTLHVPVNAWMEYQKQDTAATNEYPGDNGLGNSVANYNLGTTAADYNNTGADLGLYGFMYVGGEANFSGACDVYGAIWVVGNWWTATGNNNWIFFNDQLSLPTLNVVLVRQSWKEVSPSKTAWP